MYTLGTSTLVVLVGCMLAQAPATAQQQPIDLSIIQLVATPERYDGKRVRLVGYIHVGFEDNGIYLHKEDFERHLFQNGLWVTLTHGVSAADCQDAYVIIEGTYRAGNKGHMGLWSGAVTDITRCVRSPS